MLTVISFASIILSAYGQTKYVIDYYSLPDIADPYSLGSPGETLAASPYPLDVCLGYKVAISGITLSSLYGTYSCNVDKDAVIFTDYGTDETCTDAVNTNDKTISFNDTLAAGALGTFSCDGEANYVQVVAITVLADKTGQDEGRDTCCDNTAGDLILGSPVTTFATGVCIYAEIGDEAGYTQGSCDSAGSETAIYVDPTCETATGATSSTGAASTSSCALFAADTISVYRLQTNCVVNGVEDNPGYDYCDLTASPTTAEPTASPTTAEPTTTPTSIPTAEPSAATPSPTTASPTEDESPGSKGCMHMINYVVLLIMGMAIFVN